MLSCTSHIPCRGYESTHPYKQFRTISGWNMFDQLSSNCAAWRNSASKVQEFHPLVELPTFEIQRRPFVPVESPRKYPISWEPSEYNGIYIGNTKMIQTWFPQSWKNDNRVFTNWWLGAIYQIWTSYWLWPIYIYIDTYTYRRIFQDIWISKDKHQYT